MHNRANHRLFFHFLQYTMYRILLPLLLLGTIPLHAQSLSDIISGYQKAIGGAARFTAMNGIIVRAKAQGGGGGQKRPITFTIKMPDKARLDYVIQQGLVFTQAFDGKQGWTIQPWTGSLDPQPLNEDDARDVGRITKMVCNDLVLNGSDGSRLEYNGKDEIEGSEVYKITAHHKDGSQIIYYLDIDSYLIVKTTTKYTESGVQRESDMYPGEYKVVDGLTLAHLFETKYNGETAGVNHVESYDFKAQVDDAIFAMPAPKAGK